MKVVKLLVTIWLASLTACSLGPAQPEIVGRVRVPVDYHSVRLYLPECAPKNVNIVANLDGSKLGNFSSYQFNMRWINMLRKQAAELGANGLLLIPTSHALTIGAVRHGPAFKVRAIWAAPMRPYNDNPLASGNSCAQAVKHLQYNVFQGTGLIWGSGGL